VFGISSLGGNAIREWAANLYQAVINHKKMTKGIENLNDLPKKENDVSLVSYHYVRCVFFI